MTKKRFSKLTMGAVVLFALATPFASAQETGYMQITTVQGKINGESKDAGHLGWIKLNKTQYAASNPGVGIVTAGPSGASATTKPVTSPVVTEASVTDGNGKTSASASTSPPATTDGTSNRMKTVPPGPQGAGTLPEQHSVVSSREPQSGRPAAQRQTIIVVKDVDQVSPRLKQALATRETFTEVVVDLYRGGKQLRLSLKNVVVASIESSPVPHGQHAVETIRLIATEAVVPRQNSNR